MRANTKYIASDGLEYFMCPFTDMYISQGSNSSYSHKGIMANDVRGKVAGIRYPYYAPCSCKCVKTYPQSGQAMWQSLNKVHFANGRVDYATFMTVHDDTFDAYPGLTIEQGHQLGNMGTKGNATGVHCHIEISQSNDITWFKNKYGIYMFNNEYDTDDCYFVNDTNILRGMGGNWKTTSEVQISAPVNQGRNFVNLPANINSWRFYDLNVVPIKANAKGSLNPQKFGGLTYYIYAYHDNGATAEIQTSNFGRVKIYIKNTPARITIDNPIYKHGEY